MSEDYNYRITNVKNNTFFKNFGVMATKQIKGIGDMWHFFILKDAVCESCDDDEDDFLSALFCGFLCEDAEDEEEEETTTVSGVTTAAGGEAATTAAAAGGSSEGASSAASEGASSEATTAAAI